MKAGVVVFPGSNCDHDLYHVLKHILGQDVRFVWHKDRDVADLDAVFLAGGFSYGDYLRSGAIARFSPVMNEVVAMAKAGKPVMGICNGFQILCEAGLFPGALMRNRNLDFICKEVYLTVVNDRTRFTADYRAGEVLKIPIAHGEGNYVAEAETIAELNDNGQVVFRYCDADGNITDAANPNGSLENIAGICNREGNVLGMMPHPERASEALLGSEDGKRVFTSLIAAVERVLAV